MKFRPEKLSDDERAALAAKVEAALRPPPATDDEKKQFFELYKLMVASSEALVARRQGVNTFFLTINGLLPTAIGLLLRGGGSPRLQAAGIFVFASLGGVLCSAWRSLLISFGRLNTGKFAVINQMEEHLSAPIYKAEWEALACGEDERVYRSFTTREARVPLFVGAAYGLTMLVSGFVWLGVWKLSA